jgi:hypothetical protein
MGQVFAQAPPRPKSREIQLPWEIKRPFQEESVTQGECIQVYFQETKAIQEQSMAKACLSPVRDDSWERIA